MDEFLNADEVSQFHHKVSDCRNEAYFTTSRLLTFFIVPPCLNMKCTRLVFPASATSLRQALGSSKTKLIPTLPLATQVVGMAGAAPGTAQVLASLSRQTRHMMTSAKIRLFPGCWATRCWRLAAHGRTSSRRSDRMSRESRGTELRLVRRSPENFDRIHRQPAAALCPAWKQWCSGRVELLGVSARLV